MHSASFQQCILVGLGGALGSILRYTCNQLSIPRQFPLTTLLINLFGSLIMGMVIAWSLRNPSVDNWKLFLTTGLCGGFTTFSAFSYENIQLLQEVKILLSLLYILASVGGGITAAWLGYQILK